MRTKPGLKMQRIVCSVPIPTADELDRYAEKSGMYPTQFYSAALIIGARAMARAFNPLEGMTESQLETCMKAVASQMFPEEVREQLSGMLMQQLSLPQGGGK